MEGHQRIRLANVGEPRRNSIVRGKKGQEKTMPATAFRKGRLSRRQVVVSSPLPRFTTSTQTKAIKAALTKSNCNQKKKKKTCNQVFLRNHTLAGLNYINEWRHPVWRLVVGFSTRHQQRPPCSKPGHPAEAWQTSKGLFPATVSAPMVQPY